jgi:hypothetical protein
LNEIIGALRAERKSQLERTRDYGIGGTPPSTANAQKADISAIRARRVDNRHATSLVPQLTGWASDRLRWYVQIVEPSERV